MRTVIAALDPSAAAHPVLEAAARLAALTGAAVEAVHVRDGPFETPELLAARAGVALRLLDGPVDQALLDVIAEPHVIAAAIGARGTPSGHRPAGRTAMRVLQQANKPILVVPPDVSGESARPFQRLLLPLEGTGASSRPIETQLAELIGDETELVALHVFTDSTIPRFLDRPGPDLELLGDEFLARHCPRAAAIELRTGNISSEVDASCVDEDADMVVLSWSQDISGSHANVIREVLSHAAVPVLLLPVDRDAVDTTERGTSGLASQRSGDSVHR